MSRPENQPRIRGGANASRPWTVAILLGAAAAAAALVRHGRGAATGRTVPGGILIGDAAVYDAVSGVLLGSFFLGIAADIATFVSPGVTRSGRGCRRPSGVTPGETSGD